MTSFGEKELIDYIARGFSTRPDSAFEGIGDDCAVIPLSGDESLVVTTDMLCEGVHFLRRAASAAQIGYKSLAVNLSDVAAMGAAPVATLLSVAIPKDCDRSWACGFVDGYRRLSDWYGVELIGGDTVGSAEGITVNVVAIGRVKNENIKRRSGAVPGDLIAVNGLLGDSAAGLADVLAGRFDTPLARLHHHPVAQVREGIWLGRMSQVHAMMDISDGIYSDLPRIMERSGVGAQVHLDKIPTRRTIGQAVSGGEDYKLLFTVGQARFEELASDYLRCFGSALHVIGRITGDAGQLEWFDGGRPVNPCFDSFRHF